MKHGQMQMHNHPGWTVAEGAFGAGAALLGFVVSTLQQVELELRVASLIVGLVVGLLTVVKLIRDLRKKDG